MVIEIGLVIPVYDKILLIVIIKGGIAMVVMTGSIGITLHFVLLSFATNSNPLCYCLSTKYVNYSHVELRHIK